jgi:hypothetical protein
VFKALCLCSLLALLTPCHALQERLSALEAELSRREVERAERSKGDPVELKREANDALHRGDLQRAVDLYTQALQLTTTGACSDACARGALKPVGRTPCGEGRERPVTSPLSNASHLLPCACRARRPRRNGSTVRKQGAGAPAAEALGARSE